MNEQTIATAVAEAKRFLARHAEWKKQQGRTYTWGNGLVSKIDTPRENGALRRASMDLTRALANLRRHGA